MFYLFHGDDSFASRQKFYNALSQYQEINSFKAKGLTSEILANLSSGLFSPEKRALVIEAFFSLPVNTLKKTISQINKLYSDEAKDKLDIFLWEEKKITPQKISLLGNKKKVFLSQLPAVIFKFLDSIGRKNSSVSLNLLNLSFKTHPPELIIYLLAKRIKDLIIAKINPDQLKMASWQKGKLISQVKKLDLEEMREIYLKLIEIEFKNKTGQLGNSLKNELVNLLATTL